ncbi:MAG: endonuclease/exonuclease/phosphatase family protein [Sandaracinaceae bacterium]|nr:endonuclease/exonuclease/phosphatase family protein [Sandaracinaceae bacterium]
MLTATRPSSLLGLSARLAYLRRRRLGCVAAVVLAALVLACLAWRGGRREVSVATFNIENFPRDARQVEGAFAILGELDAPIVGVQEITDPAAFEAAARHHLGASWRFVANRGGPEQRVGVLYDGARFELAWARTHGATQIDGRGKPTLEARLRPRGGGRAVRVFVVHLKAGGDFAHVRREQLRRLEPILAEAVESWDELVVLGDFNATGDADRVTIAALADRLGLAWASEGLACTSYWDRRDGCRGSALDHVLTREVPDAIAARGPCETIGCSPGDRCPAFHREVSDHCPVTASW